MNLRIKYFIASAVIFLVFDLTISVLYYRHLKEITIKESLRKSELILQEVEAIRSYVKEVLRPRMYELHSKDAFIIEAMSTTYVSLNIMRRFESKMPGYVFRRAALKPHNPNNRANAFEQKMFDWFQADKNRNFWQGMVEKETGSFFITMVPEYHDKTCLHCHGNPTHAPKALTDVYGTESEGFGFSEGDLAGLNSVSVPVSIPLAYIRGVSISIFMIIVLIMLLLLLAMNYLFGRLVTSGLTELIGFLSKEDVDDRARELAGSSDEFSYLKASFGHLNRYVIMARKGSGLEPNFVGRYTLEAPVFAGSMSWLYRATDSRTHESAIIKIPFEDILINPIYEACVRSEIRLFESLNHPNLLKYKERVGDALIMEFIEGEHFEDVIRKQGRFKPRAVAAYFDQICDLLGYLHHQGVVHHHIRPESFLIQRDEVLKLVDLGLSYSSDGRDILQQAGLSAQGDLRYMAPEQMSGKRGDPRSDIWSIGVLLFRMLTGRFPFKPDRRTGIKSLLIDDGSLEADLEAEEFSDGIKSVILRTLDKDPDRRYQWIEDFWEDLQSKIIVVEIYV